MKIYWDSEFTSLQQNTTLISMGFIAEDGKQFYCEFTDYDKNQIDNWIRNNVINNLILTDDLIKYGPNHYSEKGCVGDTKFITKYLVMYLNQFKDIEMWSDCLAYDWTLFCQLFGGAQKIPKNIYYIPFDICTLMKVKNVNPDISREEFVNIKDTKEKHNSLFDAKVIKACYEKLMKE